MKDVKMKKYLVLFSLILFLPGCASLFSTKATSYPMSFDQTYESALVALDDINGWKLVSTNQKRGLITVGIVEYPLPEKEVTFIVERLEPFRTKISLMQKTCTFTVKKLFNNLDQYLKERALTYPS